MKMISWAIIIASFHMMPPPAKFDPNSLADVAMGFIVLCIYLTSWAGFIGALRSGQ